ncbi:MAG: MFS transporter [Clostridia bacterium]|nr:MFS transporter [Clostridia bacterium]
MAQTRRRSLREVAAGIKRIELFDSRGLDDVTRRNLQMLIYAVLFGQVGFFITAGVAWTGYLREVLHADDFLLGLIAAVPVAANTVQIVIAHWMQRYQKRRFFLIFFGLLGRFFWIPIALVPYFVPNGQHSAQMMLVAVFVVAVSIGNSFVNLGFTSLVADIVPMRIRGRYFSARLSVSLVTGLLGGLGASYLVDTLGTPGYTVALIIAGVASMADIVCFFWVKFPPMYQVQDKKQRGMLATLRVVLADKRFMRVVFCFTCWAFSVNVAVPFFNVHMLESLRMSYTQITAMNQIASNVIALLILPLWGKPLDRFGNKAILQICSRVCMLTPFVWLFVTPGNLWLILVSSLITGAFWSPIDIAQQNFYFNASSAENRAMYVAVFFAVFNLCGVALSNAVGGYLVQNVFGGTVAGVPLLQRLGWTKYHLVFLLSCVLRVAVVFGLFPRLREEGERKPRVALATMGGEWYRARARWVLGVRASILRRRYRRSQDAQDKEE